MLIRFTLASDNVHDRHLNLLKKCEGPFVTPVVDSWVSAPETELEPDDETEEGLQPDVFQRLTAVDACESTVVHARAAHCDYSQHVVSPAELARRERAARRQEQAAGATRMLKGKGSREGGPIAHRDAATSSATQAALRQGAPRAGASGERRAERSGSERETEESNGSASPELPPVPRRCGIVTPLPCSTLKAALAQVRKAGASLPSASHVTAR